MVLCICSLPCSQVRWWTRNFSAHILFVRNEWECVSLERGLWTWCILFKHNIILNKFGVDLLPCLKLIFFFSVSVAILVGGSIFIKNTIFHSITFFSSQCCELLSLVQRSNSLKLLSTSPLECCANEWKSMRVIFSGGQAARRHHFVHAKCHFKIV